MAFDKVLIANRGEIAARVMRTARRLGYGTVAVFSDADAGAPHVRLADEAVRVGGAAASESYLCSDRIIEAAQRCGAGAIHPGYGFLSENAEFARACQRAGVVFIGPGAEAIEAMGDKAAAKARMAEAGVPTVAGYYGDDQSEDRLRAEAVHLGYPLLVKAVKGGGGRGMRLVRGADELAEALASARGEASRAFGDGGVMLERFIEHGRHIEIQVFADAHGNVIHLGERDCTAQRRRQKVIEEAPCPLVNEALRQQMGDAAVRAAKAIGYLGAGTVELIVDQALDYCFLEMNTRLQVEHPVTEMVTGLDLVEWQLRIAAGEALPLAQEQVELRGHAIEARLYAEDPYAGFAPQSGKVHWFRPATLAERSGVRVDAGIAEGDVISPHYDSMIAKVIAHGRDRADAIRRLTSAIEGLPLAGPRTNRRLLIDLLKSEAFATSQLHTGSLDEWAAAGAAMLQRQPPSAALWALAALLWAHSAEDWFRNASPVLFELTLEDVTDPAQPERRSLTIERDSSEVWTVTAAGEALRLAFVEQGQGEVRYREGEVIRRAFCRFVERRAAGPSALRQRMLFVDNGEGVRLFCEASAFPEALDRADPSRIVSPVAGTVLSVRAKVGDDLNDGDVVAVVEAMKMETRLCAPRAGKLSALYVEPGAQIEAQTLVAELAIETGSEQESSDG